MRPVQYKVKIKFATPFRVGGGKGNDGIGSYLQRDAKGRPYLPGSALKGKVRHYAMLYLPCKYRLDQQNDEASGRRAVCDCIVCRMLGSGGNQRGTLSFSDLSISTADEKIICDDNAKTEMRMGNAIERSRHTARDNSLFQIETAEFSDKYVLKGEIRGYLPDGEEGNDSERLLFAAIHSIEYIGGNSSRGLGWLSGQIAISSIQEKESLDDKPGDKTSAETSLKLQLTLRAPLLIGGQGSIKNYRSTQQTIPGSVVRAALAREICVQSKCDTDGKKNFVTARGGNGKYMTLREEFSNLRISACFPKLPKALRTVPNTGYFPKHATDAPVYDTLAELLTKQSVFTANEIADTQDTNVSMNSEALISTGVENTQSVPAERGSDFYDKNGYEKKLDTMLITKSAINRMTGTVQDEMLYSLELISPNSSMYADEDTTDSDSSVVFEGTISGKFNVDELQMLIKNGLNIGGKQTSGYGYVSVDIDESNIPKDTAEELRERIVCFNKKVSACVQETGTTRTYINSVFIPLTLQTDAFVRLEAPSGYCSNDKYLELFSKLFPVCNTELCFARAQHSLWRGFDTKEREHFLKPVSNLIRAGAVFVLCAGKLTDDLLEDLLELQKHGICKNDPFFYVNNGYGQVSVADSFHIEYANGCNKKGDDQDMSVTNIRKIETRETYVPLLINAAKKFVDECGKNEGNIQTRNGKRQFTSLVAAGQQASCVEELKLYIQYKRSKEGTEGWRYLADPLVHIIDTDIREVANNISKAENHDGAGEFDEIYLQIVRQFLGYLMWEVHVYISDAERNRPRNGRR